MTAYPPVWTTDELTEAALTSIEHFRRDRLSVTDEWDTHYRQSRDKFERLFRRLNDLQLATITTEQLADSLNEGLADTLRYLAGPPISEDDLKVLAQVASIAPGTLRRNPDDLHRLFGVIQDMLDPHRFPWVGQGGTPPPAQREAALLASSVLLASQRVATERRNDGKERQECLVKNYLRSKGFTEVPSGAINTIVRGPKHMEFCAESLLGERKADVIVRLHDTRLMAIECKVSNSATNSVKRLNNDAAVKAEYWFTQFGAAQVVPVAVLAGVFNVLNLEQAQAKGLALIWSHDLDRLGDFIDATRS